MESDGGGATVLRRWKLVVGSGGGGRVYVLGGVIQMLNGM